MATPNAIPVEQQKAGLFAKPDYSPYYQGNKANDDNPQPSVAANTQTRANESGNLNTDEDIVPQPNVLDRFASYTYSASVYLMSTKQYTQLLRSKKKSVNGYNLLFQSGGAPNNNGGFLGKLAPTGGSTANGEGGQETQGPSTTPGNNDVDRGRNPAFNLDFYIDSITIDNALPGKQTQSPHMVTNLKFTVVEPGNISLLDRLYKAVQDMAQSVAETNQPINYTAAAYLMVIRWYGYDINGNLVQVGAADPNTGLTDPNAVVEKFIPFIIKKINWQVSSKLVTYEFDCAPINQMIAGGTRRGTVPYDVQLTASNVGELLAGTAAYSSATAPSNAPGAQTTNSSSSYTGSNPRPSTNQSASAPPKTNAAPAAGIAIKSGLMAAMNDFQKKLVNDGIYEQADTYEIVFADGAEKIRDAKIRLPGQQTSQTDTSMGPAASQNANQALDETKITMNISNRNWSITAGMQLVQAIDLAIRNSSFIYEQALTVYDQTTGVEKPNPNRPVNAQNPMTWFQITMEAEQGLYDWSRNDYAYKIRFIISPYTLTNFDSKYFPVTKFRGVHKRYPFWFTGENTAVLDYTANFNSLYNITVTGTKADDSAAGKLRQKYTSSMRDIPKYTYMARSSESNKGADAKGNEIPANASEYLYSPGDMGTAKLRIIGDPAWIQQGSLAGGVNVQEFGYSAFLPDGTINFDAQQTMFEIAWQRPEDYDINTGLADPYARPGNEARQPQQSTVYQATKCISEFKGGKFEQIIEGALYFFPIPGGSNTAAAANVPDQSDAETARLTRQNAQAATTRTNAGSGQSSAEFARTDPRRLDTVRGAGAGRGDAAAELAARTAAGQGSLFSGSGTVTAPLTKNLTPSSSTVPGQITSPTVSTLLPPRPVSSNGVVIGPAAANGRTAQRLPGANPDLIGGKTQLGSHDF
jgi:hypothetical protein